MKEYADKVVLYGGVIKSLKNLIKTSTDINVLIGSELLLSQYKVKLDWAVTDYKLALKTKCQ